MGVLVYLTVKMFRTETNELADKRHSPDDVLRVVVFKDQSLGAPKDCLVVRV